MEEENLFEFSSTRKISIAIMDILPSGNIFRELQDIQDFGYFSSQSSIEDQWQQASQASPLFKHGKIIILCFPSNCFYRWLSHKSHRYTLWWWCVSSLSAVLIMSVVVGLRVLDDSPAYSHSKPVLHIESIKFLNWWWLSKSNNNVTREFQRDEGVVNWNCPVNYLRIYDNFRSPKQLDSNEILLKFNKLNCEPPPHSIHSIPDFNSTLIHVRDSSRSTNAAALHSEWNFEFHFSLRSQHVSRIISSCCNMKNIDPNRRLVEWRKRISLISNSVNLFRRHHVSIDSRGRSFLVVLQKTIDATLYIYELRRRAVYLCAWNHGVRVKLGEIKISDITQKKWVKSS